MSLQFSQRILYACVFIQFFFIASVDSHQFEGEVGIEWQGFPEHGKQGQAGSHFSIRFEPEYYHEWNDGDDSISFSPFFRLDQRDKERTHIDLRELLWVHVGETWELRTGIGKVFWGVTESQHLVDIINQTDLVDSIDGEEKLGQPMINFSWVQDWGIVDIFLLPGFRERTFPGKNGRLRSPFVVNTKDSIYESDAGQYHTDFAIRWNHSMGDLEWGIYYFYGTNREPRFDLQPDGDKFTLLPFYDVIEQFGLDLQYIIEGWAFKLEAITRSGQEQQFFAATVGFEYTQVGIFNTNIDLGWVIEYLFDDRGDNAPLSTFERDIFFGARWAFNDAPSTEALAGIIWDPETEEKAFSLEASRRIGDSWKLNIEARIFTSGDSVPQDTQSILDYFVNPDVNNKTAFLQPEDYIKIELVWFF